jgi:hypothetical protein
MIIEVHKTKTGYGVSGISQAMNLKSLMIQNGINRPLKGGDFSSRFGFGMKVPQAPFGAVPDHPGSLPGGMLTLRRESPRKNRPLDGRTAAGLNHHSSIGEVVTI